MNKWLFVLFAMLVVGGGILGLYYVRGASTQASPFRSETVARGDLLATISSTGTLEPEDIVDVGAQVVGMITEFGKDPTTGKSIDYHSPVESDQVLARIDDSLYRAKVEDSRAKVNQAEANVASSLTKVDQAKARVEQNQANVKRSEADLKQKKASYDQADRNWARARKQGPNNYSISREDYDNYQTVYETSKAAVDFSDAALVQAKAVVVESEAAVKDAIAAVDNAKASLADTRALLKQDEIYLGYCTIKSPIKGVIIDRRVTIGQTVQSSFNTPSLFLLARDLKRMKIWASVNEADIGQIHKGQKVRFTVDSFPREVFEGKVDLIRLNATMTQNVVTYTVEVITDNSSGRLLPYMTANLQFEVEKRENVILVSNEALRWKPQAAQVIAEARGAYAKSLHPRETDPASKSASFDSAGQGIVWIPQDNYVRPIKVILGLTDGAHTEIIGGDLPEGAQIVTGDQRQAAAENVTNPFTPQLFGGKKSQ